MRYTVEKCIVRMIGHIWMPNVVCARDYELDEYALGNLGDWTRDNVQGWLALNTGDFQSVDDFEVDFDREGRRWYSPWKSDESELTYNDCMFPGEFQGDA